MMFAQVIERYGVAVNEDALEAFKQEVGQFVREEYEALIAMVPAAVRRKHMDKGLSFTRSDFVSDALFTREGFNLTPRVFTASSTPDKPIPSTSGKDHLPYFVADPKAGEFVTRLIQWQQSQKMLTTYIGSRAEGTGFWQYIAPDGNIYPSFALHKTNTGRTASSDPNGQNFPKRGRWAKGYQSIFRPRPGYKLAASDLSQIELRLAAWAANEPAMIQVYRDGGDIHAKTASVASGIP